MKNFSYSGDRLDGLDILDVLEYLDGVRYESGAWVLQKTDSSATTRGLHWPIVLMGFGVMRKRWCAENGFFRSYALERWGRFGGRGSVRNRGRQRVVIREHGSA